MVWLVIILLLTVFAGGALVAINFTQNRVAIMQAQAAIEQAHAVQEAARAAQVASAGQAAVGMGQTVILLLVIVAILGFVAFYLYLRFVKHVSDASPPRNLTAFPPLTERTSLPQVDTQQLLLQQMMTQQAVLLEILARHQASSLPSPYQEE
ncbi:MAG: hypothetical protein D6694_03760 [Gammaproteobacteria bacterium]|nr:MAG: hypothetical protein D6694_03760 [Gammaproteobacteria bacterium]